MITLTGSSTININVGDTFTDPGATASYNVDGNITSSISISGSVDTSTAGTYTIAYNVSDAAGNAATVVQRTVIVITVVSSYSISNVSGTLVEGNSQTATVSWVLDAEPVSDVVIDITSSDTTEVSLSPTGLTFTNANWNTPQIVTLTSVDDVLVDGDITVTITTSIRDAASDNAFDPLPDQTKTVVNADDDTAGFTLSVTASSNADYTLSGTDANGAVSGDDVSITINAGDTLNFNVDAASHPFYIKTAQGTGTDNQVSSVTNNGATNGTVTWTPTTAGTYYYQCSAHNGMYGIITVQ